MAFKFGAASFFFKYIWPPSVFAEVYALFGEWQRSDVKNKAILGVFFIPAIFSLGGLLLCIAYFVLFKLPSFILSVLSWLILISLFSGGGLFCCEKLLGKGAAGSPGPSDSSNSSNSSKTRRASSSGFDATVTAEDVGTKTSETPLKNWFDSIRKTK
jgi:hypothetical protein